MTWLTIPPLTASSPGAPPTPVSSSGSNLSSPGTCFPSTLSTTTSPALSANSIPIKVDPDQWEFANDDFIRGQTHLLRNIHRRKPIHSHSLQHGGHGSGAQLSEGERQELEDIITNLHCDKIKLNQDLQRHAQKRHEIEIKMQSLEKRLSTMRQYQEQMIDGLGKYIQKPSFVSTLMQQYEICGRKRRLLKPDYLLEDISREGTSNKILQTTAAEKGVDIMDMEHIDKMEASLSFLENFVRRVCQTSGEEMYGQILSGLPSIIPTNINSSSEEGDKSHSNHLHLSPPCLGDVQSSPELTESTSYSESLVLIPLIEHIESRPKVSDIDVNSEPTAPEVSRSKQTAVMSASVVPAGGNDVFWQQFLTETPGCADAQEAQSERREAVAATRTESKTAGEVSFLWWGRSNVDHLTEQMGQLTPAEKI